jgi:DNA-binding protein
MRPYADTSILGDIVERGNYIIVGAKPTMNYVVACVTMFNEDVTGVTLRARGRNIVNAIDTTEMLRRVFLPDARVASINIGTDVQDCPDANKSTVEMVITPGRTNLHSFYVRWSRLDSVEGEMV